MFALTKPTLDDTYKVFCGPFLLDFFPGKSVIWQFLLILIVRFNVGNFNVIQRIC